MKEKILAAPPGPHRFERTVRFQDVDAAGIIFFPRYFEYFHDAYVEFLDRTEAALPAALRDRTWTAPIVHAEADFLRPLVFGDRLAVELAGADLSTRRFLVGYRLWRGDEVVAVGHTVHVSIDRDAFTAVPLPDAPRRALEALTTL